MTLDRATDVARTIIGPAGLLGYLVGRGSWWPDEALLRDAKRAIAHVMADAYDLCRPIWTAYPQLDPAKNTDPLDLAARGSALSDTPADLCSALGQMRLAAASVLPTLVDAFPEEESTLVAYAETLVESARKAERLISEAALSHQ